MNTEPPQNPHYPNLHHANRVRWQLLDRQLFYSYFWIVFKNVLGWIFILGSPILGAVVPGPGGFPLFLLGFALVTFPGKRKLTSRVMRGRGLPIDLRVFTFITALMAILVTCVGMWIVAGKLYDVMQTVHLDPRKAGATYTAVAAGLLVMGLFALGGTWIVMRLALHVVNYLLKGTPLIRRKFRPWLRKRGFHLLPSRRKRPLGAAAPPPVINDEILEIDERHHDRLRTVGAAMLLWLKRAIALAITIGIFIWILDPIHKQWPLVRTRVLETSPWRFALAAGMFAIFLFVFRAMVWRKIVASFGHYLPVPAATRVWSTSELARYLPGVIWQVWGRVYLVRPYGVSGSVCTITQVLELAIFLLANIFVALSCLLYFGIKRLDGTAQNWLIGVAALAPVLLLLLHTKIFYGAINAIMRRRGKPPIIKRLRGYMLVAMLFWNVFGLLWQSLAIFVILQEPLGLKWDWWWVLAGAYCLAWCAGFLAFWAPGGIGVREVVFIGAMQVILPESVRQLFESPGAADGAFPPALLALLAFLSVLLRLWATAGELILAGIAYILDYRGALGDPGAAARVDSVTEPEPSEPAPKPPPPAPSRREDPPHPAPAWPDRPS